jgi:hypothetical protein
MEMVAVTPVTGSRNVLAKLLAEMNARTLGTTREVGNGKV